MTASATPPDRDTLLQLPKEQLVEAFLQQAEQIRQLQALASRQAEQINQLQSRLEQLRTDSTTSSKPPSTDLLRKPETPKNKSQDQEQEQKRKPGGQPGHPGTTRRGFGKPDRFETVQPATCEHCGSTQLQVVDVETRQVACLADRPIELVQFERQTCRCVGCQATTTPAWPSRLVGQCDIDAGMMAMLGWLSHDGHLSYDKQAEFIETMCGWRPSLGTLASVTDRLAVAVEPSVQAAWQSLAEQPIVYCDETPWPVLGTKEWLWQFGTQTLSLFHAGDTRGRVELDTRLGQTFAGTWVCDDFKAYNGYESAAQQKCLAHLLRHFEKLDKLSRAEPAGLAKAFIALIEEAFAQYRQWQTQPDAAAWQHWAQAFRQRVDAAIVQWLPKAAAGGKRLLRSLRDRAQLWWQFLDNPEVRPDNNLSERNLRLAVTKRKVSGGSRSMERFAQTADLLSVIQSCRRQGRSAMEFFVRALQAKYHAGFAQPSLIPEPTT